VTNDEWAATERQFPIGSKVTGTVESIASFGIFVSVEGVRRYGVVADVAGMRKDTADDSVVIWPHVGESITGVVVGHADRELKIHLT
jgi:ribosomal protein S1